MTCAPAASSARAQRMLRSSSKRAVNSTSTVTCLLASAARCRLAIIGEPDADPIERLLDRQDVRILGGLLEQRDHRIVGVVRVVEQHVALVDHREQIRMRRAGQHRRRHERRIPEVLEAGNLRQAREHPEVDRTRHRIDVAGLQLEPLAQQRAPAPPTPRLRSRAGSRRRCAAAGSHARPAPDGCGPLRRRDRSRRPATGGSPPIPARPARRRAVAGVRG